MINGLEISIVKYSELESGKKRIDSEYYKKECLLLEKKINTLGGVSIKNIGLKLDCSAFYPSITAYYNFEGSGVPFLRVNEIQNGLVSITEDTAFLPQSVLDENPTTIAIAMPGDIIVAKGGNTLAKVGLVTEEYEKYAVSRDLIIIKTEDIKNYNKYLLWCFYHSKYGQQSLWRSASQTGQPHLTLPSIEELQVPEYESVFSSKIESIYRESVETKREAEKLYKEADDIMKTCVVISDSYKNTENNCTRKLSETFIKTGRLDSEHYHLKFDELDSEFKNIKCTSINKEFDILKNNYSNYEDGEIGVLKTKQVTKRFINKKVNSYFSRETIEKNGIVLVQNQDVIFASMGVGSLGKANVFYGNELFATDSTLRIYRKKDNSKILPEVLVTYLQSDVGQEYIYKYIVGSTGIINIYDEDMNKIPIPVIDINIQQKIANCIKSAYKKECAAVALLEMAKNSVEMAIEIGEQDAYKWLVEEEKKSYNIINSI